MKQEPFDHQVAIAGTGFSGMAIAIALKKAGIDDFVLLEKHSEIGGTWRDNQYPGAACDVPSHLYSFSFALNPDWSRRFSGAPEIHAYQKSVCENYDLNRHVCFNFELENARYDEGGWHLTSLDGQKIRVRYLVSAQGALHVPHKPHFEGLDEFTGTVMHSAEWDSTVKVEGKRVVVIGSAASAVQIVPELARCAARVSVFQRTPNYFLPRRDRQISGFEKSMFRRVPGVQRLFRWRQYVINDFLFHANFVTGPGIRKRLVHFLVRRHMKKQVPDPALRKAMTPDYDIGCKRVLLSDNYLPVFSQSRVELVSEGIQRFTASGIETTEGREVLADLVVLATGFETSNVGGRTNFFGPDGVSLGQAWADTGIRAHRSVMVVGFPNLFLMFGPNSGLGHSSIIIMIERQAGYITELLRKANDSGAPEIRVRPEAERQFNQRIQTALEKTVWSTGCSSWYKDEEGRIFTLWPYTTTRFLYEMRKVRPDEFQFGSRDESGQSAST